MPQPNSIYHEGEGKPRRQRPHSGRSGRPRSGAASPPGSARPDAMGGSNAPVHSHRSRGARPSRRPGDPIDRRTKTELLFNSALLVVVLVYLLALGLSVFRPHGNAAPAVPPASVTATEAAETPTPEAAAEAERITAHVRDWNQTLLVLDEAHRLIAQKNFPRAEETLVQTLEANPNVVELQVALSQIFLEEKRYEEAKEMLIKVLERDPENSSARVSLVSILAAERNHAAALSVANWILKTDPYSMEAHQAAAAAYLYLDQPSLALPHLRKIIRLGEDNVSAENNLAVVYCRMGQFDKATELLEQLLTSERGNSITYYNLAVCHAQQRKAKEAIEVLGNAVSEFGEPFVMTWLKSRDFDPIRDHPLFTAFLKPLGLGEMAPPAGEEALPGESVDSSDS